ncbi:DegT/DnrJ/EryC1/StrS family aminotransferase [Parvicella tangerina]|uniref:dTDP-4-amino-4,6-dideoxy-D-glucose transaminase n=1 Tax=Parvicella tangerina TaxID=2829795 RepID=A0A916JL10_9FLAO|nr:DegT/DnrJ/EryC1/StrS family aminotransferase [Parvicella tangerina]CAG5079701.1 dTDP-4-amino-4,6-dideoxy-D-glucose transaminase [Parvicella tangerina]
MIPVTKSYLPPKDEYLSWLNQIYEKEWLTNRGNLVQLLEKRIQERLKIDWVLATNNGTIPIQIALKLLAGKGEIITTPFSYVATTSSIVWEDCKPVFVDIHPEFLTIDESRIEEAITDSTTCILATHVFGNPCNVEKIDQIAKKHDLYVIYDAAHCFDVNYNGKSLFEYGDVSTCSFHATKIFHTAEGGALFTSKEDLKNKLFYSHNFGHKTPVEFQGVGINAKLSELHAAMGLSVLNHMDEIISSRKGVVKIYDEQLTNFQRLKIREGTEWNYSYYPIIFETEKELLQSLEILKEHDIYPRRYFMPSLNELSYVEYQATPISESISRRVLCLPLYYGLEEGNVRKIVSLLNKN